MTYIIPTNNRYIERILFLVIAIGILVGGVLGYIVSPWRYMLHGFLIINILIFVFTGKCLMGSFLQKGGFLSRIT